MSRSGCSVPTARTISSSPLPGPPSPPATAFVIQLCTNALHGRTCADRLGNLSDRVHDVQQRVQFTDRRWAVNIDHVTDSGRLPGLGAESARSSHAHAANDDAESLGLSEDVVQHAPRRREMQQMSPREGRLHGDSLRRPPMRKPDDVSGRAPQRAGPYNSIKLAHVVDGARSSTSPTQPRHFGCADRCKLDRLSVSVSYHGAVPTRVRRADHEESHVTGPGVDDLVLKAGFDLHAGSAVEPHIALFGAHERRTVENVKQLPRLRVEVPFFSPARRDPLLEHGQTVTVEQAPCIADLSLRVVLSGADVGNDRH
jgi:hypothetical protein